MEKSFVDAVKAKDLDLVRPTLTNELLDDPRGTTYFEMKDYAINHIPDLFVEDKPFQFSDNPEDWDKEFLNKLKYKLDFNFSKEKLELFERVVPVVLKDKIEDLNNKAKTATEGQSTSERAKKEIDSSPLFSERILKIGAIGGVAVSLIGLCFVKPVVTLIGSGVAIASSVTLLIKKKMR